MTIFLYPWLNDESETHTWYFGLLLKQDESYSVYWPINSLAQLPVDKFKFGRREATLVHSIRRFPDLGIAFNKFDK